MGIPNEVHASIVKVAGDWALELARMQFKAGVGGKFVEQLENNFYSLYTSLRNLVVQDGDTD